MSKEILEMSAEQAIEFKNAVDAGKTITADSGIVWWIRTFPDAMFGPVINDRANSSTDPEHQLEQ